MTAVDINGRYNPEICEDILQLSYWKLPTPDAIWASIPCENFSRARTRAKTPRNFKLADSLAGRAWEIIQNFLKLNPDMLWFIENPDSSLLWGREVASEFAPYVRLDYCQYGTAFRKRTRVASNAVWVPRPLCDQACHACVDGRHVLTAQRGPGQLLPGPAAWAPQRAHRGDPAGVRGAPVAAPRSPLVGIRPSFWANVD